jgi:hypothetical protein
MRLAVMQPRWQANAETDADRKDETPTSWLTISGDLKRDDAAGVTTGRPCVAQPGARRIDVRYDDSSAWARPQALPLSAKKR